jgi:hypothetical protein
MVLVVIWGAAPRALRAQVPPQLALLTTPPAGVGTCLAVPTPAGQDSLRLHGRQLVMVSTTPRSARREITIFANDVGRIVRYAENVTRFNGVDGETGDGVVATLGTDGRWRGARLHNAAQVANGGRGPDGRSVLPPPVAVKRTPPRELSAAEQARVRDLAAWVARRCPA